jgi:two-component system nitrogen regulation sensor histidine kinase GlnL
MTAAAGPDFAELFAAIPVALLVVDPAQRIVHANAECESLLNLSERVMIGQPLDTVLRVPGEPDRRADQGLSALDRQNPDAPGGSNNA